MRGSIRRPSVGEAMDIRCMFTELNATDRMTALRSQSVTCLNAISPSALFLLHVLSKTGTRLPCVMRTVILAHFTQVRLGHQNRYQKWFQKKHLATPGAEAIVPDLVRFVCCCFHPTNQILQVECLSVSPVTLVDSVRNSHCPFMRRIDKRTTLWLRSCGVGWKMVCICSQT